MRSENIAELLSLILAQSVEVETKEWLEGQISKISAGKRSGDLYLCYSILATKIPSKHALNIDPSENEVSAYLHVQQADALQLARVYLLIRILETDRETFEPMVSKIAQVADSGELETFLKFLIFLPNPANFKAVAVDALRTNVAGVFSALAHRNPYPAEFFSDQEWNQMYLKLAFMQLRLDPVVDIDGRANKDLARIISDYAHERWAASRKINPLFWRPVGKFMNDTLLKDMEHLFKSEDQAENQAAALCCVNSDNEDAKHLLSAYPALLSGVNSQEITWEILREQG